MKYSVTNAILLVEADGRTPRSLLPPKVRHHRSLNYSLNQQGTCKMFRNIYRALVLSRTKSAATQVANQLSNNQLKDIGYSRSDIVRTSVETVTKELDQADLQRAQEARFKVAASNVFADFIANSFLRPLGSTRSHD
jgi:uncharacterized protein YjiS (DUF1127 family)